MRDLLDQKPAPHPGAAIESVGGRLMVATEDDKLHSFAHEDESPSEVGERIVQLADGTRTVREIAAAIEEEFEVDRDTAERDTVEFVQQLVEGRILILGAAGPREGSHVPRG